AVAEIEAPEPEPIAVRPPVVPDAPVEAPVEAPPPAAEVAASAEPVVPETPHVEAPPPKLVAPGRVVPPTLRLRIEEQRPTAPTPPLPTATPPRAVPRPVPRTERPAVPAT